MGELGDALAAGSAVPGRDERIAPRGSRRARVREALRAHPDLTAAVLLGLVVAGYLWPVLIGGKLLSPAAVLFGFAPWSAHQPPDIGKHFNLVLIDPPLANFPLRQFARGLIRSGTLPVWEPHAFAGVPFMSNPQTGLFSLFSVPLWVLPFSYAIGVSAAFTLWAAAFGTYLLARQLRLGVLPALLAGVGYGFSAIFVLWLTHATLPAIAALLPWMVWLVERLFARARVGDALGLAVATAVALGGGHPGMQLHVPLAVALYVAARLALAQGDERRRRPRIAALSAAGLGLGALLMGIMLVPEALSSQGTIGTLARHHGGILPGAKLPPDALRTTLLPDWWGRPSAIELPAEELSSSSAAAAANYSERTFYAGAVTLMLALIGFVSSSRRRATAPFLLLALIGLAVPLHAPGIYWLITHLPLLEEVQSQRLHFLYAFGAAVGAAFGLQAVLDRPRGARRRLLVPVGALALALLAVATGPTTPGDAGRVLRHFATGADFSGAGVLALTSAVWLILLALGLTAALAASGRWPRRAGPLAALVVLLAVGDAYHFAHGYQPMARTADVTLPLTPALAYLQRHAGQGRYVALGPILPAGATSVYGLDDVRGYDPPQPTLRWYRLWKRANPLQTTWQPFRVDDLSPEALKVVSVLGARYVVTDPAVDRLPAGDVALRPLRRAYRGREAAVFVNPNAVARVRLAPAVRVTRDEAMTRAALVAPGFDPRRTVVVEGDQPGAGALAALPPPRGRVELTREADAQVELSAVLARRGLVVLNDALTPGWSVRVDGAPAQALRVDDVMRGVIVGPGRHTIVWRYALPGLRLGLLVSVAALLALLAAGAAALVARRRERLVR